MHLLVPFAFALSEGAQRALHDLSLPHLRRLLARLSHVEQDMGDELSLSPPHERAWAQACGWTLRDGLLPFAAHAASEAGHAVAPGSGWALVHPTHWHWGTEQASLTHPSALALRDEDARPLFDALVPLFAEVGWPLHWLRADAWLTQHPSLAQLPTASLDRVIGRNVDPWLDASPEVRQILRPVRRLQAEAQMVLHAHPSHAHREAKGHVPVNSIWFSGSGPAPDSIAPCPAALHQDDRLRLPALAEDWPAWAAAWQALDDGPIQAMLNQPPAHPLTLTLCGERHAWRFTAPPSRPWWQRLGWTPSGPQPQTVLSQL